MHIHTALSESLINQKKNLFLDCGTNQKNPKQT